MVNALSIRKRTLRIKKLVLTEEQMVEMVARIAHESNMVACGVFGKTIQKHWDESPEWQHKLSYQIVRDVISGVTSPEVIHNRWCTVLIKDGWTFGPIKDEIKKTSPLLIPYNDCGLSAEQKSKDSLIIAIVRATIESMAAHGLIDIMISQSENNMEATPKHEFVYAVFLDVNNVLTPYTEEIMTLVVSRENGKEEYCSIDSSTPFYTNYQEEAFTAGVHLNQGPGRMWLFRTQKEAESFRKGLIAYALFLGKCLGGDPDKV